MWKYILFQVALHTLGRLPTRPLYAIVDVLAELIYLLSPSPRRNVWDNLRHLMGPDAPRSTLRAAARQVFKNVARNYADLLRIPRMDLDDFYRRRLRYYGFDEHVLPALRAGQGVIILSGHCGNPELAVQGLLSRGLTVFVLTEPLKPSRLSRLLDRLRSSQGHTFVPVSVGNVKRAVRTLKAGGAIALMGDRDIRGPKASLPFFGVETLVPTGPIEVALRTGAVVIPSFARRSPPDIIEGVLEEPLQLERSGDLERDVRTNCLRFLERLERHLRQDPAQWAVLERIWDSPQPAPAPPAVAAGRGT